MSETTRIPATRFDVPPPGAIAWLDVSADNPDTWTGRLRTGPLGLQISPLRNARAPYFFKGARLRGARCVWSASTVSSAELYRPARMVTPPPFEGSVQLLARVEASGSVFDMRPILTPSNTVTAGALRICEPTDELSEQFADNTHLFTMNVPYSVLGMEAPTVQAMAETTYRLSPFQQQLLRSAASLLVAGGDDFGSAASLVGVDRYLAGVAGLLLRTAVAKSTPDLAHNEQIRMRTDAIIYELSADPELTPAVIAAQLSISLRQLYRAFIGTDSPASRIRRRRLERAAEILTGLSGPGLVDRVASECGFTSSEYFSRAFRREFGISPRAYRTAHRDIVAR